MSLKRSHIMLSFLIISIFLLSACNGNNGDSVTTHEFDNSPHIEVKGIFLLEPSADLDLAADNLDSVQRYFFVIYDVTSAESNQELSTFNDSIKLTTNEINTYEQLYQSYGEVLKSFRENCGYAISTSYGTLWSGTDPVRMIAAFAINKNDITDDCSFKLEFDLSDSITFLEKYTYTDIQIIDWMDDVFAVEENPEAYQIARSVKVRAQICKTALDQVLVANQNRDANLRAMSLATCDVMFNEDTVWGVSCCSKNGSVRLSEDLPLFSIESIKTYYPTIASEIDIFNDAIGIINLELEKDTPNEDNANSAYDLAYTALVQILDFFEEN